MRAQLWKESTLPDWHKSGNCLEVNAGIVLKLHLNSEAEPLIAQHYPTLLHTYNTLPTVIQKADFQRLLVLYHFGGYFLGWLF